MLMWRSQLAGILYIFVVSSISCLGAERVVVEREGSVVSENEKCDT